VNEYRNACSQCGKLAPQTYDEASFKAGQEAGRQEVVDWILDTSNNREMRKYGETWLAKLKEWGIKE
jgi:hypothetical protein